MTGPQGELRLVGRLVEASNGTFLAEDESRVRWVYKPVAGEAPLWDFPSETLGRREVAAYALSEELGLEIVPETVWCEGPLGEGSAQAWIDGEPSDLIGLMPPEQLTEAWMPIVAGTTEDGATVVLAHRDDPRLRRVALFDALLNNSDRKGAHLIADGERVRGVDHGVSLHVDDKLRTILWGWAGDPLTDDERAILALAREITAPIAPGLAEEEWAAFRGRAAAILAADAFPTPSGRWPSIPWPPL
ncbi:MAG: SCO1664 family protein [Tessaracoccus sp.]|uniref:SCO1664 family protein n=1 Tax=Tessaracoccus sp. TaxID=1971211 RepID=UPI001EBD9886|nr:SCO1664 family protein [Tessaracoccus sp.]MBK7821500.1 SCO1664 family protein [Tessaracoccus sp.]